jgi:cell fate (sporulation/competence/biofilm development) regulator YlbF (YheA/YmcA/DUF963 family)
MTTSSEQSAAGENHQLSAAIEAAQSLGRALGECPVFRRFDAAYEALQADPEAQQKLGEFHNRRREFDIASTQGEVDNNEQEQLECAWQDLMTMPALNEYVQAQRELRALFQQVTGMISEEIDIDYGAVCSPPGARSFSGADTARLSLDGCENVLRGADEFICALESTPVVRHYAEAAQRFETDPEVQAFMEMLQHFEKMQQNGEVPDEQLQRLREAQTRIQSHPAVVEFLDARDAAAGFLQQTNQVISQILGLDFGRTAGPAAGY